MIFRRSVGLLFLLLTVVSYIGIGTSSDYARDFSLIANDIFFFSGLWSAWALIVLFMVRRELPLGTGRPNPA